MLIYAYVDSLDDRTSRNRVHISECTSESKLYCPEGHPVIAKRGEKVAHHFAHLSTTHCRYDSINKGPWHTWWQERIKIEYCEIPYYKQKDDVYPVHIADARLSNGNIIEFQYSPITRKEVIKRCSYYTQEGTSKTPLIWMFSASRFDIRIRCRIGNICFAKVKLSDYFIAPHDYKQTESANVKTFIDVDKKQLLELIEYERDGKSSIMILCRIWSLSAFDKLYIASSINKHADTRETLTGIRISKVIYPRLVIDNRDVIEYIWKDMIKEGYEHTYDNAYAVILRAIITSVNGTKYTPTQRKSDNKTLTDVVRGVFPNIDKYLHWLIMHRYDTNVDAMYVSRIVAACT